MALQFCAFGWLVAEPLFGFANLAPAGSVVAALCRLSGLIVYIFTLLAFFVAMPRYLRHAKFFCAALTVLAFLVQFTGIAQSMATNPNLSGFFLSILTTQGLYIVVSAVVGYCFYRHPILPKWNCVSLAISTGYWTLHYWLESAGVTSSLWYTHAWALSTAK